MSKASKASKTVDSAGDEALESGPAVDAPLVGAGESDAGSEGHDAAPALTPEGEAAVGGADAAVVEAIEATKSACAAEFAAKEVEFGDTIAGLMAKCQTLEADLTAARGACVPVLAVGADEFEAGVIGAATAIAERGRVARAGLDALAGVLPAKVGEKPAGVEDRDPDDVIAAKAVAELDTLQGMLATCEDPEAWLQAAVKEMNDARASMATINARLERRMQLLEQEYREARDVRQDRQPILDKARERAEHLKALTGHRAQA